MEIAQRYHSIEEGLKTRFLDYSPTTVRPLNDARAVDLGATFISESILFLVAAGTVLVETQRNARKTAAKAVEAEARIVRLEEAVAAAAAEAEARRAVEGAERRVVECVRGVVEGVRGVVDEAAGRGGGGASGWGWSGGDNALVTLRVKRARVEAIREQLERASARLDEAEQGLDGAAEARRELAIGANVVESGV
ncbi:optic atrophy 3 protein-domain-containing protein [Zopfochytrium polystomum]|nr:optic atrophy 3 protein-domain-containing protein [Zopfochytrium polystomum]